MITDSHSPFCRPPRSHMSQGSVWDPEFKRLNSGFILVRPLPTGSAGVMTSALCGFLRSTNLMALKPQKLQLMAGIACEKGGQLMAYG